MKKNLFFIAIYILLGLNSCKKFVEPVSPLDKITSTEVYSNNTTATAVLSKQYVNLKAVFDGAISLHTGLSGDELTLRNNDQDLNRFYLNSLRSEDNNGRYWGQLYRINYAANDAIEAIPNSTGITEAVKSQLLGEAKFIRAFCHFYLYCFYGNIPIIKSTDYRENKIATRNSKLEIFNQIIADLKDSQALLSLNYLSSDIMTPSSERVRPNKNVASALLSKVYLYNEDYINAEKESTRLIEDPNYSLVNLDQVFLKNSQETIWQLQSTAPIVTNTNECPLYIFDNEHFPAIEISDALKDSFQAGDQRFNNWISSYQDLNSAPAITHYFSYKYKIAKQGAPVTEYFMIFRLAEQYLIRAESRIKNNNIPQGINDLNLIRNRATDYMVSSGLQLKSLSMSLSQSDALKALEYERKIELFCEMGNRWFDMRRTGRINQIMPGIAVVKGSQWNNNWAIYPIPLTDIQNAPGLSKDQNPGY
jgi:hypothetical protein